MTVHQTNNAEVSLNTCFNIFSHAYFLEDGNEIGNRFEANMAVLVKRVPADRVLRQSDLVDHTIERFPAPAAFWISHPTNTIVRNVAIGSEGASFPPPPSTSPIHASPLFSDPTLNIFPAGSPTITLVTFSR